MAHTYIDKSEKSSTIILSRRNAGESILPMNEERFYRMKAAFEKQGGVMASSEEIDRHLDAMGASAATLNATTVLIRQNRIPTASEMFEEMIHVSQYRTGKATGSNWLDMEIETKKKLIRNKKQYDITDEEQQITINQLKELLEFKEGGGML